jgi:DNA-binding transcriptional regulator YiaG
MMPDSVDFSKVEALRKHMLITTREMAELFGVSRVTYHGWVRGQSLRQKNLEHVTSMVRILLAVMRDHGWPSREIVGLPQVMRKHRLLALVAEYQ